VTRRCFVRNSFDGSPPGVMVRTGPGARLHHEFRSIPQVGPLPAQYHCARYPRQRPGCPGNRGSPGNGSFLSLCPSCFPPVFFPDDLSVTSPNQTAAGPGCGIRRVSPHKTEVISHYDKAVTADFIAPDRSEMTVGVTNSFLLKCAHPSVRCRLSSPPLLSTTMNTNFF